MYLTKAMEDYLRHSQDELKALIRDLCAIPAPSHQEDARAAYVRDWLKQAGGRPEIDEAKNVICPLGDDKEGDVVVFMAHTDTVFPDLAPMPFREEGGKYFCPGVCDDTANLAALLLCARYFPPKSSANPAEPDLCGQFLRGGLGKLEGLPRRGRPVWRPPSGTHHPGRRAAQRRGQPRRGLPPLPVVVKTEGGHSFNAFGNRNAIRYLASMIDTLYAVKPPQDGDSKTTYNVGLISGGTSVNTIAQEAEMLYEYRSDSKACLAEMEALFERVVETYRAMGVTVEVERIGERPCAGDVDPTAYQALMERVTSAIRRCWGRSRYFAPAPRTAISPCPLASRRPASAPAPAPSATPGRRSWSSIVSCREAAW